MIKLDDDLLQELGLGGLPPAEKDKFLRHIYETLEMRVGTRLAERMTDQQLDEFEAFIDRNDDQGAFNWLETNFPNYKEVVAEEFEKLKKEIKAVASDILAASAAQAGAPPSQAQPSMPPLDSDQQQSPQSYPPSMPGQQPPMTT